LRDSLCSHRCRPASMLFFYKKLRTFHVWVVLASDRVTGFSDGWREARTQLSEESITHPSSLASCEVAAGLRYNLCLVS
jgi:hypothetical protein